ncbi:MAG: hypothetical protein WCJ60_01005 [bacterium]
MDCINTEFSTFEDLRCSGCPAVLAYEVGRIVLSTSACSYSYVTNLKDNLEIGCRLGPYQNTNTEGI